MITFENLEQKSQEWYDIRKGVITASFLSNFITPLGVLKKGETLNKALFELISGVYEEKEAEKEEIKSNHIDRGNELEPIARELYEASNLTAVKEMGFILSDCKNYGYSPDGLVDNNGLIEIKAPVIYKHMQNFYYESVQKEYIIQIQAGLMISEREYCDFISYNKQVKEKYKFYQKRVHRDEDLIKKISENINIIIDKKEEIINKINLYK